MKRRTFVGAAGASLLSYSAILIVQRRLMRAPHEDPHAVPPGIPRELDPVV